MAVLWPDVSPERARHQLRDTLYRLREWIGADAIQTRGDVLALSHTAVSCDVWRFEDAVRYQRWNEADEFYAGPLLDGSHPGKSPEFGQWLDGERVRLARLHLEALEHIAEHHESSGSEQATPAWRRLTLLEPYNSRYALRYMLALDAFGDRAGALRHAVVHEAVLVKDLGAVCDPAVTALANQLRSSPTTRQSESRPSPRVASPDVAVASAAQDRSVAMPTATRPRWLVASVIVGVLIIAAAIANWPRTTNVGGSGQSLGSTVARAQDHFVRGKHYLGMRGASNLEAALSEFSAAVQADPRFARAYAGLSSAATLLTLYDGRTFSRDSMLPMALAAANRAVSLDSSLGESFAALGQVLTYSGRRSEAESAYERAVALDPSDAATRQWYAELLLTLGRVEESIEQMEAAIRLDPLSAINHGVAANHYRIGRRFEDAVRMGERAVRLDPTMPALWEFYANALFFAGLRDSAERLYSRHSPRHPRYVYVRAKNGDQRVRDSIRRAIEDWSDGATPLNGTVGLATISLAADNDSAVLTILARAQAANPAFPLHNTLIDPIYDPIRNLPGFREIVRRANLDEARHLAPRKSTATAPESLSDAVAHLGQTLSAGSLSGKRP